MLWTDLQLLNVLKTVQTALKFSTSYTQYYFVYIFCKSFCAYTACVTWMSKKDGGSFSVVEHFIPNGSKNRNEWSSTNSFCWRIIRALNDPAVIDKKSSHCSSCTTYSTVAFSSSNLYMLNFLHCHT